MKVLLDHNLPKGLGRLLVGHEVKTAREMRWEKLKNGELLRFAAAAGFEAVLSIDKNLRHEHNLALLPLPVIVLDCSSNALPALAPLAPHLVLLLQQFPKIGLHIVKPDGTVERVQHKASP